MSTDGFKSFLKENKNLPADPEGWIDMFLEDLDIPNITSFSDLKEYLDGKIDPPKRKAVLESAPHYWEQYEKAVNKDDE